MHETMIKTTKPYGSVNRSTKKYLSELPHQVYILVENTNTRWFIDEFTFSNLRHEFPVK